MALLEPLETGEHRVFWQVVAALMGSLFEIYGKWNERV
jgi:hypothetical protein